MSSIPPDPPDFYRPPNSEENDVVVTRGNGMAVASLVCGLICCVTPIPSILAVVFGVMGIRRARSSTAGGGRMAASGLTLGLVGMVLWALLATGLGFLGQYIFEERDAAEKTAEMFVQRVADGKIDEAMALALPSVNRDELKVYAERAKPWGPLSYLRADYKPEQRPLSAGNDWDFRWIVGRWIIDGNAVFSRSSPPIKMTMIKVSKSYRVESFEMK